LFNGLITLLLMVVDQKKTEILTLLGEITQLKFSGEKSNLLLEKALDIFESNHDILYVSTNEIKQVLDVTPEIIQNWINAGVLKVISKPAPAGRYNLVTMISLLTLVKEIMNVVDGRSKPDLLGEIAFIGSPDFTG
jgi:hypothetical protein